MTFTSDILVDWLDPELLKSLADEPLHLSRDVANVDIRTLVQRVGEDIDAVALIDKLGSLRLANVGSEDTGGSVAEGDKKAVVGVSPSEDITDSLAEGHAIEHAVAAGNKDRYVRRVFSKTLAISTVPEVGSCTVSSVPEIRQVKRAAHLLLVLVVNRLDCLVLLGKCPHLQLDRISREGGYVDVKPSSVKVVHWQQHLHRVVTSREELAICHLEITLLGADYKNLPLAPGVLVGVIGTVKVCLGRDILCEREGRRKVGIILCPVANGRLVVLVRHCGDVCKDVVLTSGVVLNFWRN
ncbi:hypothetical protein HG530_001572 [Fusarium avenaceum]|nr:hypothetical protein HG530_001572 [Fusarium avenaceum]